MEIKRIPNEIEIYEYIITFSYETRKGYYREQQRKIYTTDKAIAEWNFNVWANKQRTMTNVKILGIVENTNNRKIISV
ncbi:hypothetical protein [Clostridium sp. VAP41]|uniref:hypothetical protein n=1 Tax=Clostridium sp. VAP41 TaxID=2949979 RepID=UPI0020793CEE|nr:hypothetical protein [Clostridium sp. VAP41]